jgi:transcriptional regulator with XRE-family HTH domain
MSGLSELLSEANKSGMSARAVARLARDRGHSLNHDTAARYLRGDHGVPDEATLVAFADVLGVSLARLRTAAGLPAELTTPYTPPAEASRLTRRQRRAVDEIIRAMLEPSGRSARPASRGEAVELDPKRAKPRPRQAARRGRAEPPVD